jgi:hypothetical protein
LLALFLVACMFGAYGVVRLIFWLQGEPLPSG